MKTVFKYQLPMLLDDIHIPMPAGALPLHVSTQQGVPCIWALVDTDNPPVDRQFHVRGTGHDCEGVGQYVGTFYMYSNLVFHLFEAL